MPKDQTFKRLGGSKSKFIQSLYYNPYPSKKNYHVPPELQKPLVQSSSLSNQKNNFSKTQVEDDINSFNSVENNKDVSESYNSLLNILDNDDDLQSFNSVVSNVEMNANEKDDEFINTLNAQLDTLMNMDI